MNNIEKEIIELFVRLADLLNLPRSVGELYGILYSSSNPMCLDQLRIKLDISKGSTSQGLKILRSFGAIRKIYIPGDRKDYYIAEDSLRRISTGFVNEQIKPHLDSGSDHMKRLRKILKDYSNDDKIFLKERIDKLDNWKKRSNQLLPLILKFIGTQK
tara:strand:- start:228 stop:701 length:474 start_codon:yes stop_codon:yes gene_type:complete